jgi:hypothetical protein
MAQKSYQVPEALLYFCPEVYGEVLSGKAKEYIQPKHKALVPAQLLQAKELLYFAPVMKR